MHSANSLSSADSLLSTSSSSLLEREEWSVVFRGASFVVTLLVETSKPQLDGEKAVAVKEADASAAPISRAERRDMVGGDKNGGWLKAK